MDVREKLVELLHKGVRCPGVIDNCNDCPYYSFEKACDEFGATVDLLIANGVTVQEWISVKDRLPEDGVRVFVAHDDGVVRIGICRGYFPAVVSKNHTKTFGIAEVTHWMQLPAPPKGE